MAKVIALIVTDMATNRLGLPSMLHKTLQGKTVLAHTIERMCRVQAVREVVVMLPEGQALPELSTKNLPKKVSTFCDKVVLEDQYTQMYRSARKWALSAWRGGLGGATVYDELLPAAAICRAMKQFDADAVVLVGASWMLVDPEFCQKILALHLDYPEAMQMTFTQAPPGLSGIVIGRSLVEQLAQEPSASLGRMLSYVPSRPQADPIGRDVCVQIPAEVRSSTKRFIYDTPRYAAMIDQLALDVPDLLHASAKTIVKAVSKIKVHELIGPVQVDLELTPRRLAHGPITPQHYLKPDRVDLDLKTLEPWLKKLALAGDVCLNIGGRGEPLLHPQWAEMVQLAHDVGIFGLAIETDLLIDETVAEKLLELPLDVLAIRLNADTKEVYQAVMTATQDDAFKHVTTLTEQILNERNRRWQLPNASHGKHAGLPWMILKMVKTEETLKDMETFFDRWVHYAGHAVIEPAQTLNGLMPAMSPVAMAPPKRFACRQIQKRLTVLSDGEVVLCDQDFQGKHPLGHITQGEFQTAWQALGEVRQDHALGQWVKNPACEKCVEWHRP